MSNNIKQDLVNFFSTFENNGREITLDELELFCKGYNDFSDNRLKNNTYESKAKSNNVTPTSLQMLTAFKGFLDKLTSLEEEIKSYIDKCSKSSEEFVLTPEEFVCN